MSKILGLHHMTAICGDAQRNLDFYTGVLGLRLIKITVNFDDPTAYHLYYGDGVASPGSILTFFPYPTSLQGRPGVGQCVITSLSIPVTSLEYWRARLAEFSTPSDRDGAIDFSDPDGLLLRLVADPKYKLHGPWDKSTVPVEHQICGMHSVTLQESEVEKTSALLMRILGFRHDEDAEVPEYVFLVDEKGTGKRVDVATLGFGVGRPGKGTVHHIAFRTATDATQAELMADLSEVRAPVSEVRDRDYFHSIYFREPGGVLFEIATDTPGFTTDEDLEHLGTRLCLPKVHEPRRTLIEGALPKLRLPGTV
jgi:catechol 2,3-dioxygenase-like lactoylglutathione lyase family enzyme